MREFVTAVEDAFEEEPDEGTFIKLDGREMRYYRPTDGQIAMFMSANGRHASGSDRVAGVVDFFMGLFDADDQGHLSDRLMDRTDPFGVKKVEEILESMLEEWSGRPTKSSSGSTRSQTSGGRKSTRRTPALISSGSPSTGS